jgi:hypothetical protein
MEFTREHGLSKIPPAAVAAETLAASARRNEAIKLLESFPAKETGARAAAEVRP